MTETSSAPAFLPPDAVAGLVRDRILDAELAALLSLTVEGGIPVVVAGGASEARRAARDALAALVPAGAAVVRLAGADEDFAWMPQAVELGWRSSGAPAAATPGAVMVAAFEEDVADPTWGQAAHLAIRALTAGYSLLATAGGSRIWKRSSGVSRSRPSARSTTSSRAWAWCWYWATGRAS